MISNEVYERMQREMVALASSVDAVMARFSQLHSPLTESEQRVPQAANQLDRICKQTEAATHRVLDMVEEITNREDAVMDGLQRLRAMIRSHDTAGAEPVIEDLMDKARTTGDDAFTIMDTLQFQDITAQQMNYTAALLEDIQARLHNIMSLLEGKKVDGPDDGASGKSRVFDPHADMNDKKTVQADIDSMFARKK
jgi:chemotaxis regulatin CheY-phosphate phosphatase CheZ